MPVRLVLVMVTSNSYDLGVTANTLQDITPWPGDQDTAHYMRSSFDGASVAGAYRAHIDHAARADSDHAQR